MSIPSIDVQFTHLLAAQRRAANHALHRLNDDALGMLAVQNLTGDALFDATRIAGVPVVHLVRALTPCHLHLFGVDDDDVVAAINVRRVYRPVLSAQAHRYD